MPNVIKIKSNGTAGTAPTSLEVGELALNRADGQLYYRNTSNNIAAITDTIDGGVPQPSATLLLSFDGTNGSTTFTDSSANALSGTAVGNAQISTAQSKFGGASALFDGNGDRVEFSSNAAWSFGTGDFTVEMWVRWNTVPSGSGDDMLVNVPTSGGFNIYRAAASGGQLIVSNRISNQYAQTFNPSANVWYHVAVSRASGTMRVFIDGVQLGSSVANSTNYAQAALHVGGSADGAGWSIDGYIDDLRIIKSALYTANFTPPTAALTATPSATSRTQTIRLRGATAATLASVNPTPAAREPVYETDTRLLRIGDGTTAYNSLGYVRPHVSATDRLLGRSTAGAGVAEEITCTSDARAILAANNVYACRAWVNFNATSSAAITGTYTQSGGTTITCTVNGHGMATNQVAWLTFTTGTAPSTAYAVTVTGANTFTVQAAAATTSGNVTVQRRTIRASGNVSSVAYNATGDYFVNFATAMADVNYAAVVTAGGTANAFLARPYDDGSARTTTSLRVLAVTLAAGNATLDPAQVAVAVFR